MKITSWGEARSVAKALFSWLGKHCPACGARHTKMCIDGGRCVMCGRSLCAVRTLTEAVTETETRFAPKVSP